jgi:hypothetical protein
MKVPSFDRDAPNLGRAAATPQRCTRHTGASLEPSELGVVAPFGGPFTHGPFCRPRQPPCSAS